MKLFYIIYGICLINLTCYASPPPPPPAPARPTAGPTMYYPKDSQIIQDSSCIGKNGTCSPTWCTNVANAGCVDTHDNTVSMPTIVASYQCRLCTQSSLPICKAANLIPLLKRGGGLAAAYCTDKYLVLHSNGVPNHKDGLASVPQPPGGGSGAYSTSCVTRSYAIQYTPYKIPLFPVLLPTANASNNIEYFTSSSNPGNVPGFGLPVSGPLAVTVSGVQLFPLYNNEGVITHERCEMDKCSAHSGQAFDYHYHGDPFSWTNGSCLYSPADYGSATDHPPLIAWAFDGYNIHGRHLYNTNIGYNVTLDVCGGHIHDDGNGNQLPYHYHSQVQYKISESGFGSQPYYAYIGGVYQCWRGNISVAEFFGNYNTLYTNRADYDLLRPCCNTSEAFLADGITIQSVYATPTSSPTNPSKPSPPGSPTNTPTKKPTTSPTSLPVISPTKSPTVSPTALPSSAKSPTISPTTGPTTAPTTPPSKQPTTIPSNSPTSKPSTAPSSKPTITPTASPSKLPSNSPTTLPTKLPSKSPTFVPSKVPTTLPSKAPTASPTTSPTKLPTISPTKLPTKSPTTFPSILPSSLPTLLPTPRPTEPGETNPPSLSPTTGFPSFLPTVSPSEHPTANPSFSPSVLPTLEPSLFPTHEPSEVPSAMPTTSPSDYPTDTPTESPTLSPSTSPSYFPTSQPSFVLTDSPSTSPSNTPTDSPSTSPTIEPTNAPSKRPTFSPTTLYPTITPTIKPSVYPTIRPTAQPTKRSKPTHKPTKGHKKTPFLAKIDCNFKQQLSTDVNSTTFLSDPTAGYDFLDVVSSELDLNSTSSEIYIVTVSDAVVNGRMRLLSTSALFINYTISYYFDNQTVLESSKSTLVSDITTKLSDSVTSGSFQALLTSSGSSILNTVTDVMPPVAQTNPQPIIIYTPTPTFTPTVHVTISSSGFVFSKLYIIIAAAGGGGLILIVLILYCLMKSKKSIESNNRSVEMPPVNARYVVNDSEDSLEVVAVSTGSYETADNHKSSKKKSQRITSKDLELQHNYPTRPSIISATKSTSNSDATASPHSRNLSIAVNSNAFKNPNDLNIKKKSPRGKKSLNNTPKALEVISDIE